MPKRKYEKTGLNIPRDGDSDNLYQRMYYKLRTKPIVVVKKDGTD